MRTRRNRREQFIRQRGSWRMGELQPTHLLLVLLVALLLFGGSRVSALGKGLGEAIRDFKKGLRDDARRDDAAEEKN